MSKWKLKKEWAGNTSNIGQDYSEGLEYAFVSSKGEMCHPFIYCKDFLHDIIYAQVNKSKLSIFGFQHNPEVDPAPDMRRLRLLLRHVNAQDVKARLAKAEALCNSMEAELGLPKTNVKHIGKMILDRGKDWSGEEGMAIEAPLFLCTASNVWLKAPSLLSFYTFCLRAASAYEGGDWRTYLATGKFNSSVDTSLAKRSNAFWDRFITKERMDKYRCLNMNKTYPSNLDAHTIHHGTGFVWLGETNPEHAYGTHRAWYELMTNG